MVQYMVMGVIIQFFLKRNDITFTMDVATITGVSYMYMKNATS